MVVKYSRIEQIRVIQLRLNPRNSSATTNSKNSEPPTDNPRQFNLLLHIAKRKFAIPDQDIARLT